MEFKNGVLPLGLTTQTILAMMVAESVYRDKTGAGVTGASLCDGRHSSGSKHWSGEAVDIRTRNLEPDMKETILDAIREALPLGYDVLLEDLDGPDEHIHIEWHPKSEDLRTALRGA